ncbi:hypothetical protein SAMN05518672_102661 [Chitinophaga sp. CF118]|uniref:hypothetical protein n=1 Tax=Chitinophaga sp. CF118 TaxID=1884367 RepID=UPI0008ED2E02|nr:hypothetical protein [Chitinophaga sp. CF118]SFD62298.1 hypothetical protein SAMN05518672_102661 [Chitinophaga sp. CF118]
MKKVFSGLLLATLFSCTGITPQEKAENNVKAYMLANSINPHTYEGIEFEKIEKDSISGYPYHISHLYREKNKAGEMTVSQRVFFLDTAYVIKKVMTLKEYNALMH